MKEFRYLNYCTKWSSEGNNKFDLLHGKTGESGEACFSYAFRNLKGKNHYTLIVHKGIDFCVKHQKNNACLLNIEEVRTHIRVLKSLMDIKFKVFEVNNAKCPYYEVHLYIDSNSNLVHKYALTWVRYLYEYPYSVILLDAHRLHKEPMFRFTSISNLFQLASSAYPGGDYGMGHALKYRSELMKLAEFKERLTGGNLSQLNDLYRSFKNTTKLTKYEDKGCRDVEFWTDEELYKMRLESYCKNYEIMSKDLKPQRKDKKKKV